MLTTIEENNLFCFYDRVKQFAIIKLQSTVRDEQFATIQAWLKSVRDQELPIYGFLVNLSDVGKYNPEALAALFQNQTLPAAFIVSNSYQKSLIERQKQRIANSLITFSYPEAFSFLQAHAPIHGHALSDDILMLDTHGASTYYVPEKHRYYITYYGDVTPTVTSDVYASMGAAFEKYGIQNIHSAIFDFRHVTGFSNANLNTVRSTSTNMNVSHDLSHIAVALVVGNMIQERMVLITLKVTPQEERKRIVHCFAEADQFIEDFHKMRVKK